jgi:hypothetical protein
MLGTLDDAYLIRILDCIIAKDGASLLAVANEMGERSMSFSLALQDLSSLLQKIAAAQVVPESVLEDWPEAGEIRRLAGQLTKEEAQLFYQITITSRPDLSLAPDEQTGFAMTLLRMLAFRPGSSNSGGGGGGPGGGRGSYAIPSGVYPATIEDVNGFLAVIDVEVDGDLKTVFGYIPSALIPNDGTPMQMNVYSDDSYSSFVSLLVFAADPPVYPGTPHQPKKANEPYDPTKVPVFRGGESFLPLKNE